MSAAPLKPEPNDRRPSVDTRALHAGRRTTASDQLPLGGVIDPSSVWGLADLHALDAIYTQPGSGHNYAGRSSPNADELGSLVAELEGGAAGVVTAAGMSALAALVLATVEAGDHIVLAEDCYGGTRDFLLTTMAKFGVRTTLVDPRRLPDVQAALDQPRTRWLMVESIANPLTRLVDLSALRAIAEPRKVRILCDNTFATPYLFRPLEHGAHAVWHSLGKFMGGHHDLMAGALVGDPELIKKAIPEITRAGMVISAFTSWLAVRGIRTLGVRLDRIVMNATALASALEENPHLEAVHYPAMPSHPDFDLARRLLPRGAGGILTVVVQGGLARAERFVHSLKIVRLATSLGGVQTTISHPVLASHRALPEPDRRRLGIVPGMLRFSIGCESAADIIADVRQALEQSAH